VDIIYYKLIFIASTPYYGDISLFEVLYSDSTVFFVSRMKRLSGYLTAKLNLALYPGTLATVLFTLPNGLAGTDFWSTPLYHTVRYRRTTRLRSTVLQYYCTECYPCLEPPPYWTVLLRTRSLPEETLHNHQINSTYCTEYLIRNDFLSAPWAGISIVPRRPD